ncbi:MAG: DUF559 domain-containing protein [Thermodesulfobacteriota bacterium]
MRGILRTNTSLACLRRNASCRRRRVFHGGTMGFARGAPFYLQKIIGKYIVEFYCPKANLVIELDGRHHYGEAG